MKNKKDAPWKNPRDCLWCILSIALAVYLTITMPASTSGMSSRTSSSSASTSTVTVEKKANLEEMSTSEEVKEESKPKSTRKKQSDWDKILVKIKYFANLFLLVGVATFIGAIIEARKWYMFLANFMGKLIRAARLPEIVGLAMPTALFSKAAANTVLMNSYTSGDLRTSGLIAGGMGTSYLSYIYHSLRVMYPVVATIGIPAIAFFSIQFIGGFFVILGVLIWNRWYVDHHPSFKTEALTELPKEREVKPWNKTLKLASMRAFTLIFRMLCLTVPLVVGVEYMLKAGYFDFWENSVPPSINAYFKPEMVSIVLAQVAGLVAASAIAANLRLEGIITNEQILLAFLIGSAIGNPVRMLRRNLPSALAIFPTKIACIIVFGMQLSRFIVTTVSAYILILIMKYAMNI